MHQPVLEAGSGSGRWVAWYVEQGWTAVGVDWSGALCRRAKRYRPEGEFITADLRLLPLRARSVGSVVSLGAVEHVIEGPAASLSEFFRVLRPGGVAVVTVPYLGPVRRVSWVIRRPGRRLKSSPFMRRAARRTVGVQRLSDVMDLVKPGWTADVIFTERGVEFYQYQLTRRQMRSLLGASGFDVVEEFVAFHEEGLLHNIGRVVGKWDQQRHEVALTRAGRALRRVLPVSATGHMLCYVLRRPV